MSATTDTARKILLVEDDKFLGDIVQHHLERAKYTVLTATTGEEAIRVAEAEHPDLVIVDIVLSGINGLDMIARLREKPETKDIPFIVFSNSDEKSSVARGAELGAVKYLVKAVSTPEHIRMEVDAFFKAQ